MKGKDMIFIDEMFEWVNERMNGCMNEMRIICMESMHEWVGGWMRGWVNESLNEWMHAWINALIKINEMNAWHEWI